jgi:hypothetical protein
MALVKSLGKICRGDEVAVVALGTGHEAGFPGCKGVPGPEVCENRSRVVGRECALFMRRMMPPSVPSGNIVLDFGASPQKRNPKQGAWGS